MFRMKSFSILFTKNIALFLVLLFLGLMVVYILDKEMKSKALEDARQKARLLLDRNLATHTYFTEVLKPNVLEWSESFRDEEYFDPTWMSSTYAIRKMDQYFKEYSEEGYYYKECAINARSPENEADIYEKQFLRELQSAPDLEEKTEVRKIDGALQYVVMRRGETLEQSCLMCHSEPEAAPRELVARYGDERSFHRDVGEVASAISIRIPLEQAYAQVEAFTWRLTVYMVGILLILFGAQYLISRHLIYYPLKVLRKKSQEISSDQRKIGETIDLRQGREWVELSNAFNQMSLNLRNQMDQQEEMITKRTENLVQANEKLGHEVEERKRIEGEQKELIQELQEALEKVKRLSGLIPICSSCKKIRDDKGYWNQLEEYIRDHSDADFTHSICEECAKKYFPGS